MKQILITILLSCTFLFGSAQTAQEYWNKGQGYYKQNKLLEAGKMFEKAYGKAKGVWNEQNMENLKQWIVTCYSTVGNAYNKQGYYADAASLFEKVAVFEELKKQPSTKTVVGYYDAAARYFLKLGYFKDAARSFDKLIPYYRKSNDLVNLGGVISSSARCHSEIGEYKEAEKLYNQALSISQQRNDDMLKLYSLDGLGWANQQTGKLNKALRYYEKIFEEAKKINQQSYLYSSKKSIGNIYREWGDAKKALQLYNEAVKFLTAESDEMYIAEINNAIGIAHNDMEQYNNAIPYLKKAIEINLRKKMDYLLAANYSNVGVSYFGKGNIPTAIDYYKKSLEIETRSGNKVNMANNYSLLGAAYGEMFQYTNSESYFIKAEKIFKEIGDKSGYANCLQQLGAIYMGIKQYDKAVSKLTKAASVLEEIRRTATGAVRREYMENLMYSYQNLIFTYMKKKDFLNAVNTIETSRTKYLSEQLSGTENIISPSLQDIQSSLQPDEAMLVFANASWTHKIMIAITKDKVVGLEKDDSYFLQTMDKKYGDEMDKSGIVKRNKYSVSRAGTIIAENNFTIESLELNFKFDDVISFYRHLLTTPSLQSTRGFKNLTGNSSVKADDLNKDLYDFLVKPVESTLKGKKKLYVMADGILGYLPFETLVDGDSKYMIENFDISYMQSFGVQKILKNRSYNASRKPMLAFGGAEYSKVEYGVEEVKSENQLKNLEDMVDDQLKKNGSMREAYAALGVAKWNNIPGTLEEVNKLKTIVPGTEVFTGQKVDEKQVKDISKNGSLENYKVLHFATHGIVVPEIPELSALVLTQQQSNPGGEDGYLRMDEISKLKIKADFVNLSACETGLGKIYGGEGVVGLTQSFLVAGANALSVSLWQVADKSTSDFMIDLYSDVQKNGKTYKEAVNNVKRQFIKGKYGEELKKPYYWAPFVYYGL